MYMSFSNLSLSELLITPFYSTMLQTITTHLSSTRLSNSLASADSLSFADPLLAAERLLSGFAPTIKTLDTWTKYKGIELYSTLHIYEFSELMNKYSIKSLHDW